MARQLINITLVPQDPMASSDDHRHQSYTLYTRIHVDKTQIHIIIHIHTRLLMTSSPIKA